jgi:hypothetical protein
MGQAGIIASPRLRVIFLAVAAAMLFLWGWSLVPPIENWNNPYDDGFSYVGFSTPPSSACRWGCCC